MSDQEITYRYRDQNGATKLLRYDNVLSELTINEERIPFLNLCRVSQTENILVLTYRDLSTRVIMASDPMSASTIRAHIYSACTEYCMEKTMQEYPHLGVLNKSHLNKNTVCLYIHRTPGAGSTDACPVWVYRILGLTADATRYEYGLHEPADCARLLLTHFTQL